MKVELIRVMKVPESKMGLIFNSESTVRHQLDTVVMEVLESCRNEHL